MAKVIYKPNEDIFKSSANIIVNPVNCVGVMGKGLALEFKKRYPEYFDCYVAKCKAGLKPGVIHYWHTGENNPELIASFPTKDHWRGPSSPVFIIKGLEKMVDDLKEDNNITVAFPKIGCGLGGLNWSGVSAAIISAFANLDNITLELYGEKG